MMGVRWGWHGDNLSMHRDSDHLCGSSRTGRPSLIASFLVKTIGDKRDGLLPALWIAIVPTPGLLERAPSFVDAPSHAHILLISEGSPKAPKRGCRNGSYANAVERKIY